MKTRSFLFATLLGVVSITTAFAQTTSTPAAGSGEISKRIDPGRQTSRFFLRDEYREREDGEKANFLEGLYEFPVNDRLNVRLQAVFVNRNPTEGATESGLGDITTRVAYRFLTTDAGNSYFFAIENKWDTASDDTLGTGKNLIAPTAYGFIKLPQYKMIAFPLVQTFFTMGGDDARQDISYSLIRPMALRRLENRYYLFFEPSIYVDHKSGDDTTGNLEIELGRFVDEGKMMVYGRPGFTMWGDDTPFSMDWNFEVGFRYFMK